MDICCNQNKCCKQNNKNKNKNKNTKCWQGYNNIGSSIYSKRVNVPSEQLLFQKNVPSFFHLEMGSRRNPGPKNCKNYDKHKKVKNKNFSFSEILDMRKSVAYYDPRAFTKK